MKIIPSFLFVSKIKLLSFGCILAPKITISQIKFLSKQKFSKFQKTVLSFLKYCLTGSVAKFENGEVSLSHFIKIKWEKDLSFCHTKRRKNFSYFVCSSTKNMRTVLLHSILFLQVKSIESSKDDSTKKVVVFGRLLSSKHSLPKINLV